MKALILVGGEGIRLRPLTLDIPKPMVPVDDGRPFLQYLLDWLKRENITEVVMLTGYKKEKIEEYFGDGSSFGIKIEYTGTSEPLGTAGQIKPAEKFVEDTFILLNGDSYFPVDLRKMNEFHKKSKSKITIALKKVADTARYGLVKINNKGKVLKFIEKGKPVKGINTINAGVYIVEPEIFDLIPSVGKSFLEKGIFPKVKDLYGLEFDEYFIDIGTHKTYEQFKEDVRRNLR